MNLKKTNAAIVGELAELKEENGHLKVRIRDMERALERNEQYNRKTSLILSGNGIPPPPTDHVEATSETRNIVADVIKNNLKVYMQGSIVACHRLKNKKRVLVKFQDMEDRDSVYQARFEQPQSTNKIIIHENLTETRAYMVKVLGQLREGGKIVNYHTKNGMIYARDSRDKKYVLIEPWLSEDEVIKAVQAAPNKAAHPTSDHLHRSQTLGHIPQGHVASRAADMSELMEGAIRRQTRQRTAAPK